MKEKSSDKKNDTKSTIISMIVIVLVVVLIRTFIITPGVVNGDSMYDTLHDGDLVLVNKIGLRFGIERFDIVAAKYEGGTVIKRVIGLPNETIKYADNVLYVDGKEIETPIDFEETDDFTLETGKDEYILLGDNRGISKDSRVLGTFNIKNIKGKVKYIIFPFRDAGKVI